MNIFLQKKKRKVFIPCQFKTDILGYWIDKEGKLYTDNLLIQSVNELQLQRIKDKLFQAGELAVFYIDDNYGYIADKEKLVILRHKKELIYKELTQADIDVLINKYGGFTSIYNRENKSFTILIYY